MRRKIGVIFGYIGYKFSFIFAAQAERILVDCRDIFAAVDSVGLELADAAQLYDEVAGARVLYKFNTK